MNLLESLPTVIGTRRSPPRCSSYGWWWRPATARPTRQGLDRVRARLRQHFTAGPVARAVHAAACDARDPWVGQIRTRCSGSRCRRKPSGSGDRGGIGRAPAFSDPINRWSVWRGRRARFAATKTSLISNSIPIYGARWPRFARCSPFPSSRRARIIAGAYLAIARSGTALGANRITATGRASRAAS